MDGLGLASGVLSGGGSGCVCIPASIAAIIALATAASIGFVSTVVVGLFSGVQGHAALEV